MQLDVGAGAAPPFVVFLSLLHDQASSNLYLVRHISWKFRRYTLQSGRALLFTVVSEVCLTHQPRWAVTAWLSVAAPTPRQPAPAPADPMAAAILQLAAMATAKGTALATTSVPPPLVTSDRSDTPSDASPTSLAPPPPPAAILEAVLEGGRATAAAAVVPAAAAVAAADTTTTAADAAADMPALAPPLAAAAPPRIFVSVASYRDPEAPHTLHSLFAEAALPSRVFVGVCFQVSTGG